MDNGGFRAQHQIFSHLFLAFEDIAAATSLLPDKLQFLTNWKPWDIDQARPEGCAVLFCWLLSGFLQAAWCPQERPGTASGAALGVSWRPKRWHPRATSSSVNQTWWNSYKNCSTKHSLCWRQVTAASACIFHQWLSDLVVMLDITHLGYMKKHVTTTLPNERLKPAGIQDSWMEKWNNPVWCFSPASWKIM